MLHWVAQHGRDFAIEEIARHAFKGLKGWLAARMDEAFRRWSEAVLYALLEPLRERIAASAKVLGACLIAAAFIFFAFYVRPAAAPQSR